MGEADTKECIKHEKHQKPQKFRGVGEAETEEMTRAPKNTKSTKKHGFGGGGRVIEGQAQRITVAVLRLNAPQKSNHEKAQKSTTSTKFRGEESGTNTEEKYNTYTKAKWRKINSARAFWCIFVLCAPRKNISTTTKHQKARKAPKSTEFKGGGERDEHRGKL